MYLDDRPWAEIKAVIGASQRTVQGWAKKAWDRGWEVGTPILEEHITNAPRPDRPQVSGKEKSTSV